MYIGPTQQQGKKVKWPSLTSTWPRDKHFICGFFIPKMMQNNNCFCLKIIYTGTELCPIFHAQVTPICHLPAASAKRWFHENRVLRSKDVASGLKYDKIVICCVVNKSKRGTSSFNGDLLGLQRYDPQTVEQLIFSLCQSSWI
jgi:hypothetical protein